MKLALIALLAVLFAGLFAPMMAADRAGSSEVVIGFAGGAVWTSNTTGTCLWYFPIVRGFALADLFNDPAKAGRETAYLIWVSDFSAQILEQGTTGTFTRALIPAGTGTVYYSDRPETRKFTADLKDRSTWGAPVAKFIRNASLLSSPDAFASDSFIFSADLEWTTPFELKGRLFNFRNLIPHGMTCFEIGLKASSSEAGSCLAVGPAIWF